MGYRPQSRMMTLKFPAEHHLHGLEIRAEFPTLDDLLSYDDNDETMLDFFLRHVREWNLENDMGTMPIERASLGELDSASIKDLREAWWSRATGRVSVPLDAPSGSTEPPEVLTLPMESL
jgi:hypothetical protein